jgi:hydrogenase nickel incorporation protein HypA/HybF
MSITRSMMEIVREEMDRHGVKSLKRLKVRVGELTAVEPDTLVFCFEACVKGTPHEGAVLEIEDVPLMGRCVDCSAEFRMENFLQACPECDGASVTKTNGHELDIVSMEAE